MANVKKFVYVSSAAQWEANKQYITESTGKWFKSIVFRADTNEIYNRGKAYGLSVADAQRVTDLESAVAALETAQLAVKSGDKVLTIAAGTAAGTQEVSATLGLNYDSANKKIQLLGKENAVISDIDASAFIKDSLVKSAELVEVAEPGVTVEVPYIKITFNTSEGVTPEPIRFSVKSLVDIYTAANVNLTSGYNKPSSYTPGNIKNGASLETVVGELVAAAEEAKANGVQSVGGVAGALTLKAGLTANGDINLAISEGGEISATIVGLGSAAFTESSSYATAAQGELADSAILSLTICGKTLSKAAGTLTAAEVAAALSLGATSTGSDLVSVVLGGTVAAPTLTVSTTTKTLSEASAENNGLALAADVKKVIDDNEAANTQALNALGTRISDLEDMWEEL